MDCELHGSLTAMLNFWILIIILRLFVSENAFVLRKYILTYLGVKGHNVSNLISKRSENRCLCKHVNRAE